MMKTLLCLLRRQTFGHATRQCLRAGALLLFTSTSFAQIASWNPTGLVSAGPTVWPAASTAANITVTGLTKGSTIGAVTTGNAWGGTNWTGIATSDGTFTIKANTGFLLSLTTLNFDYRRSGTGPTTGLLQYAINGGSYVTVGPLAFSGTATGGTPHPAIDLSSVTALQNLPTTSTVTIRLFPNNGAASGTWYINGAGLKLYGNIQPVPPACTAPSGMTTTTVNATSATIDWNSLTGISGFEYVVNTTATDPAGAGTPIVANSFSPSGLTPSTLYYIHVRTDCGSGTFSSWTTHSFTTNAPCADPTSLTVNSFNANSTDISWTSETGITGFEYVLDMIATDPMTAGTATTGNTFTDNTLTPSTTYYFHLRKNCGSGDFSEWINVTFTTNAPCADPTALTVNSFNANSTDISWTSETGITGFEYVLDMIATDPMTAGTATTGNTFTDNTLTPSTTYYFHLRKNCGSGDFSEWINVTFTTNAPCADPTALTVNSFNANSTDISWTSETGITGFEYVLDMIATDPMTAGTATTGNTFTDNTLTPSTTYYFHLRKNCGSGDFSNWITVTFTTNAPCADPTALTVNSFNANSTDISWTSETGITGFEYVLDMTATDPMTAGIATTGNTFNDNTLTPSTTYYFHLRKNCGSGDFSNWITVTFTTNAPCADPTSLSVAAFDHVSASFTWDNVSGITGFEYVLDMVATDPTGAGTATTASTFSDNSLTPLTTYYFHLRKDCGSGDFSEWVTVSFTTLSIPSAITETPGLSPVSIYPNPTSGLVQVMIENGQQNGTLTITDALGKTVNSFNLPGSTQTIDISALAPQVYYFTYTNAAGHNTFRIVKQ